MTRYWRMRALRRRARAAPVASTSPWARFARVIATLALAGAGTLALAQDRQAPMDFRIPAQPLDEALLEFSVQSGRSFFAAGALGDGGLSRPVDGRMTPGEALRRLLEGSGYTFAFRADGSAAVTRVPPPSRPAAGASGRTGPEPEPRRLEQVVVTGFRPQPPPAPDAMAVGGMDGVRIDRLGLEDVTGVLRLVPGVATVDTGAAFTQLQIRGISGSLGGNENGYYLDDAPFTGVNVPWYPDTRSFDLDRVEVLKGPQGTRFGEGSLGGTVRIITRAPELDRFAMRAELGWDSTHGGDEGGSLKVMANVPLVEGRLALRAVATRETLPGWLDSPDGQQDINAQHIDTDRVRLLWKMERGWAEVAHAGYDLRAGAAYGGSDAAAAFLTDGVTQRWDSALWNAGFDFEQSSVLFTASNQALQRYRDEIAAPDIDVEILTDVDVRNRELRWSSRGERPLQWVLGFARRTATRSDEVVVSDGTLSPVRVRLRQRDVADAYYGEATWTPQGSKWAFTAGLRHVREQVRAQVESGAIERALDAPYARWLPRLAVSRQAGSDGRAYLSLANGFRPGQLQSIVAFVATPPDGRDVPLEIPPDRLRMVELGTRQQFLDGRLRLDAAIFHGRWRDPPVRGLLDSGVVGKVTAEGARILGAEVALRHQPWPGFGWEVGASYVDSVIEDSVDVPGVSGRRGAPVYNVPPLTVSASVDGSRPLGDTLSIHYSANAAYSARRETTLAGGRPGDPTLWIGAGVGMVSTQGWGVFMRLDNATDEDGAVDGRNALGLASRYRPRTLRLEFQYAY